MASQIDMVKIDEQIRNLRKAAEGLDQMSDSFPAIKRNTARILASIKMMEINVSDALELMVPNR